ncbi:PAS domain S-box protein [Pedobacter sp. L105]|uniref:PAS domain S-box protein n=1 Tax=Pedobacter sp. L105 TaxID=1641871 RepID=UPI00131DF254|nr:PAS domain S-box protein [Pedobacter sp. L105]
MTDFSNIPTSNEKTAAASEARFRALVTATSDVIYGLSADWQVMYELDGRGFLKDADEPTNDWMTHNIHPEDMEKVKAAIADAIREKKIFQLEHQVLRADGTPGWTFSRAVPILDDQGEILEWFGTASDITERKKAEEGVNEWRAHSDQQKRVYETITSNTPDLMYVFDLNYRFTYANTALLSMWGKTWDNAIGKGLLENGYEPWHAEMHEREIDKIKLFKKPIRGEVSFPHATLGRRVYDYILTPVLNEQGEVEAVAGTTRDITERKQWEDSLANSAEELQAINEEMASTNEELAASNEELLATNDELALVNHELIIAQQKIEEGQLAFRLAVNAANFGTWLIHSVTREFITDDRMKELFGYYPGEPLSLEQSTAQITEEYRDYVSKKLESAFSNGTRFDMEYPIIGRHDGKIRWVRSIGEMQHSGGKEYFTGVLHEITEKKQDEIRKNDFIGMVSHELKTPLTSMKGYIQLLMMRLKKQEDEFITNALEKANAQVAKMSSMINGFLNISRLESGKIHIDQQNFDLAQLVKEAEDESLATIQSHRIIFEPVKTILVNADRDKIGQVIHNLVSNAVKYSPQNSIIDVACFTVGNHAHISVTDHGMGIKPDDLSKIFDRYYRVEGDHMYSISGFGIGLYLCAEIIHRHQGEIWAESQFGKGSTFTFSLPLEES